MAHPLHQDPEPPEAKRRRERLPQQVVQGKCLTCFDFSLTEAAHMMEVLRNAQTTCLEGYSFLKAVDVTICTVRPTSPHIDV